MASEATSSTPAPDADARKVEIYTAAFKKYDKDDSNSIDAGELAMLLTDLGWKMSKEDVDEALAVLDKDKNGDIGLDEFLEWSNYAWKKFVLGSPAISNRRQHSSGVLESSGLGGISE